MLSRGWGWHRHTERDVRWLLPGVCGPAGHSGTREGKKHKEPCSAPGFQRVQSKAVSTPPQGAHSPGVLWDALHPSEHTWA